MVLNLLRLHRLARNGDGLSPALRDLLARREAIEADPRIVVLHPGVAAPPARGGATAFPGATTAFPRKR